MLSTATQIYVGLKCNAFDWRRGDETLEAVMMCLSVLWDTVVVSVARVHITEPTRDEGLFLPAVHAHPLFFDAGVARHHCDLCGTRIVRGGAWRCKLCDFDMCPRCAARKDAATVGENVLRSDSGVKAEARVSSRTYLGRALALCRHERPLFVVAFALLMLYAFTNLALPNYQGKIIDRVVGGDRASFVAAIRTYVLVMATQGLFSALYSTSFAIVARKILFRVKNELFRAIIRQDVAFFDGTTSGHLTSRLTNDVNVMMEPIRSSLSTLLYNLITLVGGVTMCYVTSYQLSLLAFVTVGPIMYLWDLYGNWSKKLTRMMLAAWGEANSFATEALGHIRTVKAFVSEPLEVAKFEDANRAALRLGVRDAFGFGATSALTGYLDLGTGVLILWCARRARAAAADGPARARRLLSGTAGCSCSGRTLSVGSLITFQLCGT